jgi:putative transposase
VKLPISWTVQRTFAWSGRRRRRSKDRENGVLSLEPLIKLAMLPFMLHRLGRSSEDAEFRHPSPKAA